jgi:hypothetical protein
MALRPPHGDQISSPESEDSPNEPENGPVRIEVVVVRSRGAEEKETKVSQVPFEPVGIPAVPEIDKIGLANL